MELIDLNLETQLIEHLTLMEQEQQLKTRVIEKRKSRIQFTYYSKTLFHMMNKPWLKIKDMGSSFPRFRADHHHGLTPIAQRKSISLSESGVSCSKPRCSSIVFGVNRVLVVEKLQPLWFWLSCLKR